VPTKAISSSGQNEDKPREQQPGGDHEQGRGQQHPAVVEAVAMGAQQQGERGGTQQGGGAQHAHLECAQAQRQQIGGQQDTDEAVDEGPQGAGNEQQAGFRGSARGRESSPWERLHVQSPSIRPSFFMGVSAHQA
jgi:hypothetical protein